MSFAKGNETEFRLLHCICVSNVIAETVLEVDTLSSQVDLMCKS